MDIDIELVSILAARDGLIKKYKHDTKVQTRYPAKIDSNETYEKIRSYVQEVARQQFSIEETARAREMMVRNKFRSICIHVFKEQNYMEIDVEQTIDRLFDDIMGYGPVEKYFFDPEVTEIIINGIGVRTMKHGKRMEVPEKFETVDHARRVVERMVAPTGRMFSSSNPRVSARLFDGSRLMAHMAPVTPDGITATIRRFGQDITTEKLLQNKTYSREILSFLKAAVLSKQNIFVSGGTGSGKTTILNILASYVPTDESLVTVEDTAEMRLQHPDVRRLEARPASIEGKGAITIRELMGDALRMLPERIIQGESRWGEAFDMIQAMITGHLGSMSTGHANSARHMIMDRLVNMIQMAGMGLERDAILDQIANAVDLVVHITREKSGRRRVDHITEIVGPIKGSDGITRDIEMNEVWRYDSETDSFQWVTKKFHRADKLREAGWRF